MKKIHLLIVLALLSLIFTACPPSDEDIDYSLITTFDIFTVQSDGTTVLMNGEIKDRTLFDFNSMLKGHPNIKLIQMGDVPGSSDDEINFQVGVSLREKGINIHILDDSEIASGGVDFFLAGVKRTCGVNTKLGVHSWSDDEGKQATNFPKSSDEHRANIKYYEDLGYSAEWAKDFYFFTIYAAPANNIHWMTEEEISKYKIFTD